VFAAHIHLFLFSLALKGCKNAKKPQQITQKGSLFLSSYADRLPPNGAIWKLE